MAIDDFGGGQLARVVLQASDQDEAGGIDRDPYTTVWDRVPVTVRETGGNRSPSNDKAGQTKNGRLYFTTDLGLTTKHEIVLIDGTGAAQRWLRILAVVDVMSMGRSWQVDFEERAL